ncbi:uncharacterized protein LOC111714392 [Eurytemora carolleeae]|uniref:uncharacterized protein LOC111714392 n=1 Tax=Eurytemora carolleeae TaxID=1294199 RepID=UPI000C7594CE|nr:uncharacterized protein LOC111714392 [Eurytemora carolleeae]|eukprot:XP_023345258.1 uncharacterized protein LOC111714392 [Eurytemora affinis]
MYFIYCTPSNVFHVTVLLVMYSMYLGAVDSSLTPGETFTLGIQTVGITQHNHRTRRRFDAKIVQTSISCRNLANPIHKDMEVCVQTESGAKSPLGLFTRFKLERDPPHRICRGKIFFLRERKHACPNLHKLKLL